MKMIRSKTTLTHLSWSAEELELMISDASFRALEAEIFSFDKMSFISNVITFLFSLGLDNLSPGLSGG